MISIGALDLKAMEIRCSWQRVIDLVSIEFGNHLLLNGQILENLGVEVNSRCRDFKACRIARVSTENRDQGLRRFHGEPWSHSRFTYDRARHRSMPGLCSFAPDRRSTATRAAATITGSQQSESQQQQGEWAQCRKLDADRKSGRIRWSGSGWIVGQRG